MLYGFTSAGRVKEWEILVERYPAFSIIRSVYGQKGCKKTVTENKVSSGKNIGKANETTHFTQALSDAESKYNKRLQTYTTQEGGAHVYKEPMLALKWNDRKKDIVFPCYVQPKLDGLRANLVDGTFFSRKGKEFFFLDHVQEVYKNVPKNIVLDGELYSFDVPFEELAGLIKRKTSKPDPKLIKNVHFYVFDCYDRNNLDLDFEDRMKIVKRLVPKEFILKTEVCKDQDCVESKLSEYVSNNFEGVMIRNKLGKYKFGSRSKDLQKLKLFQDAEYEVVDFTEGTGRDTGTIIFICKTPEGNIFNVRPTGTIAQRSLYFKQGRKYIGKYVTVKFQELSEQGIPRFPVCTGVPRVGKVVGSKFVPDY
jgi:ATP dependent DNA ligase domain/DNA ligase OB-like domain